MKVLKFGGSSIGSHGKIIDVKKIIREQNTDCIVIVSAFKDVTDHLMEILEMAQDNDKNYSTRLELISRKHLDIIDSTISENLKTETKNYVNDLFNEIKNILTGVSLLHEYTLKIKDLVASYGERLSSYIISKAIEESIYVDSRSLIRTNSNFGNATVDFCISNELIRDKFEKFKGVAIVPGFIAQNENNQVTTLGRGGSDYTAAIIAAALNAERLEIWTNVDGFMTADPKKVNKAFAIEHLSYSEAMELSHFGAKVIYTPTIQPVYKKKIEVLIKNTFNPESAGTIISNTLPVNGKQLIKGISSIDEIDLITLQGAGMVGVKGMSARLFGVLGKNEINIILITQASSEYSITFAVAPLDSGRAMKAIHEEFANEIDTKNDIIPIIEKDLSIIAIVGEKMKNTPGISANLFRSLSNNGISVIATAQGSSELNISVVIKKESLRKALNLIHEGFFLSHYKELHLFLVGIGLVGKDLLKQIQQQQKRLMEHDKLKVHVIGISNSRKMLINEEGIDLNNYMDNLEKDGEKADLKELIGKINNLNLRNSVFIDCTANEQIANYYKDVLNSYVSIVAANKVACSSDYNYYLELKKLAKDKNVKFQYETNVGAGLPIITTINDLIRSGDEILKMEAVLSGTLNFIFNVLSEKIPLSKAIMMAKDKGFSEPDPRIDLSGIDVVRKLLILSRESGYAINKEDVKIKTFLPDDCFAGTLDDFWSKVSKFDQQFEKERKKLEKENKKWRFVAILDNGKASVELITVDSSHPSYNLEGSNNIILLTTARYNELPMVIKGYGAGAEVTAAGVFADIIRIANI